MEIAVRLFAYSCLCVGLVFLALTLCNFKSASKKLTNDEHHFGIKGMKWGIVRPVKNTASELDPRSGSTDEFISWLDKELKAYDPKPKPKKLDEAEELALAIEQSKSLLIKIDTSLKEKDVIRKQLQESLNSNRMMVLPPEAEVEVIRSWSGQKVMAMLSVPPAQFVRQEQD